MNTNYTEEEMAQLLASKVQGMKYLAEVDGVEIFSTDTLLALWEFMEVAEAEEVELYALEPNSYVEGGFRKLKGHLVKKVGRTQFILD